MFKGTPRFSAKQFFHRLESKGAHVNAFTQRDATVYHNLIASEHLETVIDMEADRLANLVLTQADLDAERKVVTEERRLRIDSNFGAQHLEELQKLAFPGHPYGWPTIGFPEDLERLTLEECRRFFETYYQPANALVTIAGDFDYERTRALMRKYYEPIFGRPVPEYSVPEAAPRTKELRHVLHKPVATESLLIGYDIPSMYSADADAISMLGWALFGMSSSRAHVRLVREKQLALNVNAEAMFERAPHLFLVSAELRSGVSAEEAERELDAVIAEVQGNPITADELLRLKNAIVYHSVNELRAPSGMAGWLASGEFYWKDQMKIFEKLDRYHAMTARDLTEAARKYLRAEKRVVVVMKPQRGKNGRK
jgi:zinc protease